jgi:cytochrome c oxidase assembly protein subunit 15
MGCPDWPKCFGTWVPPTNESQLPAGYRQYYSNYRHEKNIRFARYLEAIGFRDKASLIRNDESILAETEFNGAKTWTEYINRLVGSMIGIFVIINLVASFAVIRTDKKIFIYSFLLLIVVIFQGWIGSIVVSTNLVPWMVTLHMLLAMLIVAIILYLIYLSRKADWSEKFPVLIRPGVKWVIILSTVLLTIQVLLGTQVREAIDSIASSLSFQSRSLWIPGAGLSFLVHRSFSLIVLFSQGLIVYYLMKQPGKPAALLTMTIVLLGLTITEAVLGAIMAYAGIPAMIQPVHLLTGVIVFGIQFLFVLVINNKTIKNQAVVL